MRIRSTLIILLLLSAFVACSESGLQPSVSSKSGGTGDNTNGFKKFVISEEGTYYDQDNVLVSYNGNILLMQGPFGKIEYDIDTGYSVISKPGEITEMRNVFAEVNIDGTFLGGTANNTAWNGGITGGTTYRTYDNLFRGADSMEISEQADKFGTGVKVTVRSTNAKNTVTLSQNYFIYKNLGYLIFDAVAAGTAVISTNYIAPLRAGIDGNTSAVITPPTETSASLRFLAVPYDNDDYTRYNSRQLLSADSESYEVTAVFDNDTRKGFITGSVSHDIWKTGIRLYRSTSAIQRFSLFNGITSFQTRDTISEPTYTQLGLNILTQGQAPTVRRATGNIFNVQNLRPHGAVSGASVASSKMFFGFCDDWRDGMEEYGKANSIIAPPLTWTKGPPFGWNTWSAYGSNINYIRYTKASDFIKTLPNFKNGKNQNYINFDSYWDNLSEAERKQAAEFVRANGQNAGIYHTPFTNWWSNDASGLEALKYYRPEGVPEYTWYDIVLKDSSGNPVYFMQSKGWVLDPTHPGTIKHNQYQVTKFRCWGFEYLKLDFLSHGATEGKFHNKSVTTGTQAYNYGMKKFNEAVGPALWQGNFFISLSIAPIFPSQYAHSRRISCDVFGTINDTEYLLNCLTYGWWIDRYIYPYNDPDHITLYNRGGSGTTRTYDEAVSAYLAAALCGGNMINSDDITQAAAAERVSQILNNETINSLVADERTFRPVEGNTGTSAAVIFIRDDRDIDGLFYLAYFNTTTSLQANRTVSLERINLDPEKNWRVVEMVSGDDLGTIAVTEGNWNIGTLAARQSKLFQVWASPN